MNRALDADAIIVGGGPSGLMAGRDLALKGYNVVIVERNNYLGGGFWMGGYLMNIITIRSPAHEILKELDIPYENYSDGLYTASAPQACAKLIAAACDAGVNVLNMTAFEDVILKENRVSGVVVNWSPVYSLPPGLSCVDPISVEAKVVIDASGHDAVVVRKLENYGLVDMKGTGAMWVKASEDLIVEKTSEVYNGLVITGMAVSATYGLPRMGPTFGAMLLSGKKCAEIAERVIKRFERGENSSTSL